MTTLHEPSRSTDVPRREFLRCLAAGAAIAVSAPPGKADSAAMPAAGELTRISDHLSVYCGPIHVGVVRHGDAALLIDFGDSSVAGVLKTAGVKQIQRVLFTHYHRDQSCGVFDSAPEAEISVPAGEQGYFAHPEEYWNNDTNLWNVYRSFRPDHLMPTRSLAVDQALAAGDEVAFGPARIRVVATPGHTDGSVSYLVEVDDRRVVFCGDAIAAAGQIWDVHSLQKGFSKNGQSIGGYHGFMGDQEALLDSLQRIKQAKPDLLVPSHGTIMRQPAKAIDLLVDRFAECYENYVSISALRHYFPALFTDFAGLPGQMPLRPGIQPPACLRHFGTTWMLVSETGAAFVMDAGSVGVVSRLEKMLEAGEIKRIDGLWVTHYHFDHTAGIPLFQEKFDCPCLTDKRLAEVLTDPTAWRLPCLAAEPIRVEQPMEDEQSWTWHEFKLTSYFYPGQTLYHAALLAEHDGLSMLFVGDSHTMGGLDDYCAHNRNLLGRGVGFQYCLSLIEKLKPTHLFNCHVQDAFTFTPEEIQFMRNKLDERERLFGQLVPWDHANYGTDASWVRCTPYTQQVPSGTESMQIEVVITNHSTEVRNAACRLVPPPEFATKPSEWSRGRIPAKQEARLPLQLQLPTDVAPGRYVVPIDIEYDTRSLPQFTEAIVDVGLPENT